MARNTYNQDEKIKYKFNGKSLKKVLGYVRPYRKVVTTMSVLMLFMSFISLIPPMLNSILIDNVISKEGAGDISYSLLGVLIIAGIALAVYSDTIFTYFRTRFMTKTGHDIVHDLRYCTFERLQKFSFDYYDSRPNGKILARITSYLDELADVFANSFVLLVVDILKIIIIVVCLFILNWFLALIILAAILPMTVLVMMLRTKLTQRHRDFRNKRSNRTAYIAENIQGHNVVKVFNRIKRNNDTNSQLTDDCNKSWDRLIRINEFQYPVMDGFFYVGLVVVYIAVTLIAVFGLPGVDFSIGSVIAFITYMGLISGPLNEITTMLQQISRATSNLESVFEIIETEETVKDDVDAAELPEVVGNVTFNNVTFAYENNRNILENVSFEIPAGKSVALVGPTGAGKTTVVSLISRFYDIKGGQILIDGHDISKVTLHSLRTQIGVMMQDSFIFSGTIIDNIRYGKPDATDEEAIAAAKAVYADTFIEKLEKGYYTETKEQGAGLSTGERQLISFARVVLTNPKILILDEATASIDTNTEALIKNALNVILEGRTSFVIAHRLSTIQKSDCIFYIADKGIAEAGTHESLLKEGGRYAKLVNTGRIKPEKVTHKNKAKPSENKEKPAVKTAG